MHLELTAEQDTLEFKTWLLGYQLIISSKVKLVQTWRLYLYI